MGNRIIGSKLEFRLRNVGYYLKNAAKKGLVAQMATTHSDVTGGPTRPCFWLLTYSDQGSFSSTTKGYGVQLLRSTYTAVNRIYADDGGAVLYGTGSVPDIRTQLVRTLVTTSQTGGHIRLSSVMGHIKAYNAAWNTEQVSGLYGYVELVRSAATFTLGGYGLTAGVIGEVESSGTMTVDTNHIVAGLAAVSKLTSGATQTGVTAGLLVSLYDTSNWSDATARSTFKYGLYIKDGSVATGGDIRLSGGATISSGSAAPNWAAVQGSLYLRTGQAVNACMYLNTNGSTGWTLLNALA